MQRFEVDATDPANLRVTVGGRRQKGVTRVAVEHVVGQDAPRLFLTYVAGGRYEGDGDVYIAEPSTRAVHAWLDRVNPGELERIAANLDEGLSGPMSPGVMFLTALKSMLPAEEVGDGQR